MANSSKIFFSKAVLPIYPIALAAGFGLGYLFDDGDDLSQDTTPPADITPQVMTEIPDQTNIPAPSISVRAAIDDIGIREPYSRNREAALDQDEVVTGIWGLRSVPSDYERYNATVRITDGNRLCTGSIINMEGYETQIDGVLVSTAAHCLISESNPTIAHVDKGSLAVNGLFQDESGVPFEYEMINPSDVWVHPNYSALNSTNFENSYANEDLALIFFRGLQEPDEVKPYRQAVFDYESISTIDLNTQMIITAGYSSATYGLSVDECNITAASTWFDTDCNHVPGASGGPSFPFNNPYEVIGVTSFVKSVNDTPIANGLNFFTHGNLSTVPFIYQSDVAEAMDFCAEVLPEDGLRLRTGPGTDYRINGPSLENGSMIITNVDDAADFSLLDDEGRTWTHVRAEDGREGYVAALGNDNVSNIGEFEACN